MNKRELVLIVVAGSIFGALWGIRQGMIMSMTGDVMHTGFIEGVRGHEWFRWYHAVGVAMMAAFALSMLAAGDFWCEWKSALIIAGAGLIAWELSEIGYMIARWGELRLYEHLTIIDVVSTELRGGLAYAAHMFRLAGGITLISIGGRK